MVGGGPNQPVGKLVRAGLSWLIPVRFLLRARSQPAPTFSQRQGVALI
ncbi:hypothetical protein [Rhizobium leguminosarum]